MIGDWPDVGTKWRHVQSSRVCKVVGNRVTRQLKPVESEIKLVEFRYLPVNRGRLGPTQTLTLNEWHQRFTTRID